MSSQDDLEAAQHGFLTAQFIDGGLVKVPKALAQVYSKMGRPVEAKEAEETARKLEEIIETLDPGRTNEREYGWCCITGR